MKYIIKRNNNIIATIRPEGQLQAGVMGEETVTMTFSLTNYVHFQTGDTVEVYGNIYYLSAEPQVEKISSREFRYSLEFQGIKYELGKVQYLFPDAQNVLNLSEFHIMGNARTMLDLLVQNANRTGQGWSLGTIDETEAKQLSFSAENCLAVLSKIAQEFKLEYWVDGDKSIHLTERKAVSGYSFQYGKAKGLKSLTRQMLDGSNIVTRLYAFGSEKNIAGDYRSGQSKLRMPVPFLEKNTDIYGVIEGSQTFDVFPHRLGTVTAVNPANPLQFTDSGMDFDLNARENGNTKYLINGVPVKVTFNTGQLAGYTFEVKQYGYNTATKTFTLLKNQDEKAIEVPSDTLRPAIGDRYVLTDLIMPESYVTNAEQELQQKAQAYLDENSRQRIIYSLTTDPIYFREQNVNIVLGTTIRAVDTDFNLDDNLRVIRLTKDLQNPYNVQFEVAERAEIAYIVREYFEAEKAKTALVQADKFNAEMARRAYRFGQEISENVFDGEGYFNTEKIKPLSIETKLLSVGSRMQQFALPDVVISVENATIVRNTQGKIVHLTLEERPREWQIPSNTQNNVSAGFNYIYIKAQRIGSNASVFVSPEKIGVESDPAFYHFEAGYLGSVESGNRRIRMSHGFTQINPFEITTGRIAPPSGNHYIELLHDRINIVGNVHISNENINQIKQGISPDLLSLENRVKAFSAQQVNDLQIGGRNLILNSALEKSERYNRYESIYQNNPELVGKYVVLSADVDSSEDDNDFAMYCLNTTSLSVGVIPEITRTFIKKGKQRVYTKPIRIGDRRNNQPYKLLFEAYSYNNKPYKISNVKMEFGTKATDWSPAPEDLQAQIQAEQQSRQNAINEAKTATELYARQQAELTKQLAIAHADGKISEEEQKRINALTLNLQQAKTYAEQKVNSLQVGGRNYVLNSRITISTVGNNSGGARSEVNDPILGKVVKYSRPTGGGDYQFQFAYHQGILNEKNLIYMVIAKPLSNNAGFHFGIWQETFNVLHHHSNKKDLGGGWFAYWTKVNNSNIGNGTLGINSISGDWLFYSVGIFQSDTYVDWSPAPEDTEKHIADVRTDLETAIANAKALLQAEINNVNSITQRLSEKTDFLSETKINGNTIATGAVMVGNALGGNAGINGSGVAATDVRFWSGSNFASRSIAPFRVLDNGKLHATNAEITGKITATSGSFKGEVIATSGRIGDGRLGIVIGQDGDVTIGSEDDLIDEGNGFIVRKDIIGITRQFRSGGRLIKNFTNIYADHIDILSHANQRLQGIRIKSDGIYRVVNQTETKIL